MKKLIKKRIFLLGGIFFYAGFFTLSGQISNTLTDRNISLDSKDLYEHGYNKDFTLTPDTPREDVDTVMVTSVMNYFVMPDVFWNGAYFLQNNYSDTDLTTSIFDWTVTQGSAIAQNPNLTGTSPWVKITWGSTVGAATVTVKEIPQGISDPACDGTPTTIPVHVIAKPTIGFNQVGSPSVFSDSECYNNSNVASAYYDFPITVTTSSSEVLINYTLVRTDLISGTPTTSTVTDVSVGVGTGVFQVLFSDYGEYKVTITQITDRIARKCDVLGDINTGADEFTFKVLPTPEPGKIYHIPNNF